MTKYNRPNGKLFGSSASNIGVFGSGQTGETPTTSTDPNAINTLNTHWEDGWNGAVVSQAPYTAPFIEDMNAVNYVNSYNSAYLLQRGIPEYDANEEYQADSVCTYNGEIWICLQDSTTGVTPTEGAYWHMQAEVPVMNDNAVLVGQTGVGATVTDTLNQGDIVATTSGLDVKAGAITNTHISSQAGDKIAESKINLAYATSTLNTNITNVSNTLTGHTSNTSNPHTTTISNLNDTNISGSLAGDDTLVYDGINSKWINTPNTVDNLKNVTITTISQGDTLSYDGTKWVNQEDSLDNLTNTTITSVSSGDALTYNGTKWVNTENSVDNLTNVTITSENAGDTLVYDGTKWVNSPDSLDNLIDTALLNPSNGDALIYNGSNWINQENSVANLSDTNVSTPSDGDVLVYDSLGASWNNQTNSLDNLTNTTITTPSSGDALVYDGSKWVNNPPSGSAISTLSDVTLTTPLSDGEVLLYDSSSTKWINSNIIEVNDIANINTATTDITLTASDKRHQIFTATDGFNITLPSTGIKAGEKFIFDWDNDFGESLTTAFIFKSSDGTAIYYAYINNFQYIFIALIDNPTSSSDWYCYNVLRKRNFGGGSDRVTGTGTTLTANTGVIVTLKRGVYDFHTHHFIYNGTTFTYNGGFYINEGGVTESINALYGGQKIWIWSGAPGNVLGYPGISNEYITTAPLNKSITAPLRRKKSTICGRVSTTLNTSGTIWVTLSLEANLIAPITDTNII